jgi:hypothetical protein
MLVMITKDAVAAVTAGAASENESLTLAGARQWGCDRAIIMTADC